MSIYHDRVCPYGIHHSLYQLGLRKHSWMQRQSTELTKFLSDRDSARWNLPPKEVERRRVLFWDLFVADSWNVCLSILDLFNILNMTSWQSLDAGRPPIFNQAYVNCKFPQNPTENKNDKRESFLVVSSACKLTCRSSSV